jgi:hypothetical protein
VLWEGQKEVFLRGIPTDPTTDLTASPFQQRMNPMLHQPREENPVAEEPNVCSPQSSEQSPIHRVEVEKEDPEDEIGQVEFLDRVKMFEQLGRRS